MRSLWVVASLSSSALAQGGEFSSESVKEVGSSGEMGAQRDGIAVNVYYANWCSHCQALAPYYQALARSEKDHQKESAHPIQFDAIDCASHPNDPGCAQVRGFPTVKIETPDGEEESTASMEELCQQLVARGESSAACDEYRERAGGPQQFVQMKSPRLNPRHNSRSNRRSRPGYRTPPVSFAASFRGNRQPIADPTEAANYARHGEYEPFDEEEDDQIDSYGHQEFDVTNQDHGEYDPSDEESASDYSFQEDGSA